MEKASASLSFRKGLMDSAGAYNIPANAILEGINVRFSPEELQEARDLPDHRIDQAAYNAGCIAALGWILANVVGFLGIDLVMKDKDTEKVAKVVPVNGAKKKEDK